MTIEKIDELTFIVLQLKRKEVVVSPNIMNFLVEQFPADILARHHGMLPRGIVLGTITFIEDIEYTGNQVGLYAIFYGYELDDVIKLAKAGKLLFTGVKAERGNLEWKDGNKQGPVEFVPDAGFEGREMIHELRNPIDVHTPLGYGKVIAWIDYGPDINTVWKVVYYSDGRVRNVYDDDIRIYPNAMDGGSIDIPETWKEAPKN